MTVADACRRLHVALQAALRALPGGVRGFVDRGPETAGFALLASEVRWLAEPGDPPPERLRSALERLRAHVLTADDQPRRSGAWALR